MMSRLHALAVLLFASAGAQVLEDFGKAKHEWMELNDPVMGGKSTATFAIDAAGKGVFNGTCAIVPSLKAPGFCSAQTKKALIATKFPDASGSLAGGLVVAATTSTPDFTGFKIAFRAKGIPHTSIYGGGSFKAPFALGAGANSTYVPFSKFSYDWSGFTGACDTKDPNGQQHHCCGAGDLAKYCPTAAYLAEVTGLEIWAEGAEGDFHLEVSSVTAVAAVPEAPGAV